jgi:hypothetical protein
MIEVLQILLVILLLAATGVLATFFGADTRDGRDWQPRSTWEHHS